MSFRCEFNSDRSELVKMFIYSLVIMACINLGNSLESTKNRSPNVERYNFFDAELLQMFIQKKNTNVLISPIGIKLVLGMLMEGAADTTADEIRAALRLPDDEEERRKEFNTWLSALQTRESSNILKIANRMFLSDEYTVNLDYEETLKDYYSGGITTVKFQNGKEASRLINAWVRNQTSQLIPSLVEEGQIIPDNKLVLASAIYFKGFWSNPFAPDRTAIRCFYSKKDECTDSLMMMETGYFDYGYISRLDARAIVLPYKGGKFSMLLFLPSKKDDLELLGRDLVHVSLRSVLSELKQQEVFVQIPQFEISYNDDLVKSLEKVQIFEIFNRKANLSKIFSTRLESISVSHIYHSAKITVNEEGSEAAAATGALFVPLMGGTTTSFVANHPFLFFVINTDKNIILFAGKIISPQTYNRSKKRIFPPNSQNLLSTKIQNRQQGNSVNPLLPHEKETARRHSSVDFKNDFLNKSVRELKHNQREPQKGLKFMPVNPKSQMPSQPSSQKGLNAESMHQFRSSLLHVPVHRTFVSHPVAFSEKEIQNYSKREKTAQESSKNRRWQESSDDWRHHVLFFT